MHEMKKETICSNKEVLKVSLGKSDTTLDIEFPSTQTVTWTHGWVDVQHTHLPGADRVMHRLQLRAVQVPVELPEFEEQVRVNLHVHRLPVREEILFPVDLALTWGPRCVCN